CACLPWGSLDVW
nr:immunoglobulin heavy chain junction region [Macaca mulatta]MOY23928.1 immunoglobulin heavy chain junction region [Macaca mulatta]MOY25735.1 immunoglobulin heavy chain junction region [Macaca mulatta]